MGGLGTVGQSGPSRNVFGGTSATFRAKPSSWPKEGRRREGQGLRLSSDRAQSPSCELQKLNRPEGAVATPWVPAAMGQRPLCRSSHRPVCEVRTAEGGNEPGTPALAMSQLLGRVLLGWNSQTSGTATRERLSFLPHPKLRCYGSRSTADHSPR